MATSTATNFNRRVIEALDKLNGGEHAGFRPAHAKGIMLSDGQNYMLAVLPASHHLRLADLREELGQEMHLASEDEVGEVFRDCEFGAIPPIGSFYGLNVIIDDSLAQKSDLYFEGGDHTTLIHLKGADFAQLNAKAQHGTFSERM